MSDNAPRGYRKKPVEIEAMQWDGTATEATPIIDWIISGGASAWWDEPHGEIRHELSDGTVQGCPMSPGGLFVNTLEGVMRADNGDWIIRGVQGEFYPCKPEIFAATYAPVVQSAPAAASTSTTLSLKVVVDVDELRVWAERHADNGHQGVAHVLYEAIDRFETLGDLDRAEEYAQASADIAAEAVRAAGQHSPFSTAAESWSLLWTEVGEIWDAVRANDTDAAIAETIRAGAAALRFVADMRAQLAERES